MKDLHNRIEIVSILDPITVSATATYDDIDLAGWESAELLFHIGVDAALTAAAYWTVHLYDSADGTTYAVVETADMLGVTVTAGLILTIDSTAEDNAVYHYGYVGGQRYLRIIVTEAGTALTTPMSIALIKGNPQDAPVIA